MTPSSPDIDERARNVQSFVLRAISAVGQNTIASAIKLSAPTVSRFCSDEEDLLRACQILVAAGLKVVSKNDVCVSRRTYDAYKHLACEHMRAVDRLDHLSFGEE